MLGGNKIELLPNKKDVAPTSSRGVTETGSLAKTINAASFGASKGTIGHVYQQYNGTASTTVDASSGRYIAKRFQPSVAFVFERDNFQY